MTTTSNTAAPHFPVRKDWLALHDEPVLEPDLPIIDAHHHLWDRAGNRYFVFDFLEDAGCGHRIDSSVFMECSTMYRCDGPQALRCVGETEFANGCAAVSASGDYGDTRVCAAIVGGADLLLGHAIEPVIEAHQRAGGGRFRGVRQVAAWHENPAARGSMMSPPAHLLTNPRVREAMSVLERHGLTFETFIYHTQLAELTALAEDCPGVTIILDHIGGPIGIGPYAGHRDQVFAEWRTSLKALARLSNVRIKLGGLGMRVFGHDLGSRSRPPTSEDIDTTWGPWLRECIEIFGADRCMFESNFPVDKGSCSYRVVWNGFKRTAAGASPDEKAELFHGTASEVYGL